MDLPVTSVTSTTTTITTPTTSRRSYVRRSTALGQFYMSRTEQEQSAIERISAVRKEAADHEKKLNAVWLRTAEGEEISKRILEDQE